MLLEMLQHKFGGVPSEMETEIRDLSSLEELDRLILRVLDVNSLAEFGTDFGTEGLALPSASLCVFEPWCEVNFCRC